MTARIHLVSGPRGSGKTATLLDDSRRLTTGDPGAALWLVPTRRCIAEVRRRSVTGLRLATFASLVESLVRDQHVLSDVQRRLIAEEVTADAVARGELCLYARVAETNGFAEALLGLVEELDDAGIRPSEFARAAYRREGEPTPTDHVVGQARVRRDDRERARLVSRFQRRLDRLGIRVESLLEVEAARLVAVMPAPLLEGVRAVYVDGFVDFSPGQRLILDALQPHVKDIWISLHDEPGEDRAEMLARPRQTRAYFAADLRALPPPTDRPAGLAHLATQLFRPSRRVESSSNAVGIEILEAPGLVGEVRLVARRIRALLVADTPADDILVVARDLGPYADLVAEVFTEYAIPVEIEGSLPLTRFAGVGVLLRALRLPEDDFPFPGLTALLRHGHFRPAWLEAQTPDIALLSEALLRLLAEPRGRGAYLAAVDRWADAPPVGLEDETAEESRRQKTHDLAVACRAFLRRLFQTWDYAPAREPLEAHVEWLRRLADDLGFAESVRRDPRDQLAWDGFWAEVVTWQRRLSATETLDRRTFLRRLETIASSARLPRGSGRAGRVRILSAITARNLSTPAVFLLGLGERGFPHLGSRKSLLNDEDRVALGRAGLALGPRDPLADEMLLFTQVITGARRALTLSYPAIDQRGQDLLPGSFLLAVEECFRPGAIPRERRSMLLDGFDRDVPLSLAEYRVRVGMAWPLGAANLAEEVRHNLTDAAEMARRRFGDRDFTAHDGLFTDPLLIDWVGRLFGPSRVFSPTALEDYVACPFRFFLRHLLHLDPLDEPSEEVEVTRRGMTYHRALSRLHQRLRDEGRHRPAREVEADIYQEMRRAVDEDIQRAPGPASQALWRLEGERLLRSTKRYNAQWSKFVEPWTKVGVTPLPHLFEADFGLPVAAGQTALPPLVVRVEGIEVRISGRIDRVDISQLDDGLGFWIIDYKTGRASHYTGPDLATFRKLQLTLYALAVEEVLLGDHTARPLGLAYWLVSDTGSKVALPGRNITLWRDDPRRWAAVRDALRQWIARLATNIRRGAFPLAPRSDDCTATCPYGPVCRIGPSRSVGKVFDLPLPGAEGGS